MERIAYFDKVSFDQYKEDCVKSGHWKPEDEMKKEWDAIKLPSRATSGSAGYDFFMPLDITAVSKDPVTFPTGIRCRIAPGWVLLCMPKSGLGFKYGTALENTVGVIDSDYYSSDNEGHIMAKMHSDKPVQIRQGKAFMQGLFVPFGITADDDCEGVRNGGFGSTDS